MSCRVLVTAGDKQAHENDVPSVSLLVHCTKYVDLATAWLLKEVCFSSHGVKRFFSPSYRPSWLGEGALSSHLLIIIIIIIIIIFIIIAITAIELSLGGSSPFTSTDRTNKNKCT